jgi:signal transduction histidine kinase
MKKVSICVVSIIMLLIVLAVYNVENKNTVYRTASTSVNTGWQYKEVDSKKLWTDFNVPGNPNEAIINKFVWVRTKLPKGNYREPSVYFYTYNQNFQVFIDGKKIYSFGNFNNKNSKRLPGSFWHIIDLPDNYGDKYIYIKMCSVGDLPSGVVRNFEVSSRSNLIINIIKKNLLNFTVALLFVIIGFSALFVSLIKLKKSKIFIYFSLCCITAGMWLIAEGSIKQIFIYTPELWEYIKIISQYLMSVTFSLFIDNLLNNKFHIIFRTSAAFHGMLLAISLLCDLLNIMPVNGTLPVYYCSFGLSMLISIIVIMKTYLEWDIEIKIFTLGFSTLCAFGIFDILNWNFNKKHSELYLTQWGIIVFLGSLSVVIILHYIKAKDEVIEYSEKLRLKERILIESQQQLEFFANISHELRTPLNIILSTLQLFNLLIKDGSIKIIGKDTSNYFDVMKQNCFRLLKLVNNLIDMNKIDSGYLKADFENRDIVSVVEDITQSAANYIKSRGISIIFDTDIEEKFIACDIEKIERIMLNLLSNAVKFSEKGGSIWVDINDMGTDVVITVTDTGIGIKKDKLEDIFERFVQVDKSFTRNHEGSGIGLSLVKSLVEMHGGKISVKSEYGQGSKFSVSLPVKQIMDNVINESNEIIAVHKEKINIEFSDIYL